MALKRWRFLAVTVMAFTATQFTNCDQQDGSTILDGPSGTVYDLSIGESGMFLNPKINPPQMDCTQDHVQIGGVCETNGAEDNYIEYSLTRDKNPVPWNVGGQQVTVLREARCENGRYFLVVPRPDQDSTIAPNDTTRCYSAGCWAQYQLNSRMFVRRKGTNQYDLAYTAPALNFRIQLIIQNGNTRVCPQ